MNFHFSLLPFLPLSCSPMSCNSSHFTIEFTIEKFVWHYCVQCESNFICVLFGGESVSHWKYKVQTNLGNSKGIILKKKRPKIGISLWKYQYETDLRHRKNAGANKGLCKINAQKLAFHTGNTSAKRNKGIAKFAKWYSGGCLPNLLMQSNECGGIICFAGAYPQKLYDGYYKKNDLLIRYQTDQYSD